MWTNFDYRDQDFREYERDFSKSLRRKARFLVDENMGEDAARLISDLGYNTVFVDDVGLRGKPDEAIFAYAWKHKRFILTHDRDFLDDKIFPYHRNAGVAVLPGATGDGSLERALVDVLRLVAPFANIFVGAKIEVTPDMTWTMRAFSKQEGTHILQRFRLEAHGALSIWNDENN